ncbi:helix-turn-helix domain-containing protein [Streptomyces sp. SID5474]|nr:helix-turn-helix domain-containing protein [Streptomyces sp. SID5474]
MRFEAAPDGVKRLHRFGLAIRAQRERKGLTLADMAAACGYSTSAWSRYENGSPIPPELPAKLDEVMGTQGMFAVLWDVIKDEMWPDRYRDYMRLEDGAREIGEYAPYVIPGLLQTPAYARALFEAVNPDATPEAIESMVDLRMSRQTRLRSADPPYVSAVLDEAVIRREVGGPAVLCEQLEALLPAAGHVSHAAASCPTCPWCPCSPRRPADLARSGRWWTGRLPRRAGEWATRRRPGCCASAPAVLRSS